MEWIATEEAVRLFKTLGTVIVFVIFTGVVLWAVFRPKRQIDRWASLPLDDAPPDPEADDLSERAAGDQASAEEAHEDKKASEGGPPSFASGP